MASVVSSDLAEMCARQAGVLTVAASCLSMGESAVRWRLSSGRWRRVCHGVLVTQSGPLTEEQRLWVAVLAAGDGAVLAGLTAARLDGLGGFDESRIHLLIPASRQVRKGLRGVAVHRSIVLADSDVHPVRRPPRTRLARSLVDAAAWATTDRLARAVLAAGVQQRLVRAADLSQVVEHCSRGSRRALIRATLADVAGGAHALSELDFTELVRRYGLPEPDRQVRRADARGNRWLDAVWEWARLVAEIDGRWHMSVSAWWADMQRDNELTVDGYRVLRFPAFAVRESPSEVAAQLARALRQARDAGLSPPGRASASGQASAERRTGGG
jgi:very-short-patch-repair endonuclease